MDCAMTDLFFLTIGHVVVDFWIASVIGFWLECIAITTSTMRDNRISLDD